MAKRVKAREKDALWVAKLPNDPEHIALIEHLRQHLSSNYHTRLRGRGSRLVHGNQAYIPIEYATELALYIEHQSMFLESEDRRWATSDTVHKLAALQKELDYVSTMLSVQIEIDMELITASKVHIEKWDKCSGWVLIWRGIVRLFKGGKTNGRSDDVSSANSG